jgi:hypothetical protein
VFQHWRHEFVFPRRSEGRHYPGYWFYDWGYFYEPEALVRYDTEYNDEDYNQPDLEEPDDDLSEQKYDRIDQVEIEELIRDAEEQGENEIENASDVEETDADKENEFKENDIANEIDIKQNDTDDENKFDDNDVDYHDTKNDDYKPDLAAEQEEKNGNDGNERDDDSEVETPEDVLPTVTDDEEQSVQETPVRRSTRTITRPSRYNATQLSANT